jgi:hypothetical protein
VRNPLPIHRAARGTDDAAHGIGPAPFRAKADVRSPAAGGWSVAGRPAPHRRESDMSLLSLLLTLVVVGVLLWLVNTYIPMDAKIKRILNVVVVVVVVLWLLNAFGLFQQFGNLRVGRS